MHFREAKIEDIPQMQIVRNAVNENQLSDPALVKDADYDEYLLVSGKGWVCEVENNLVGFAIADLEKNNIWAWVSLLLSLSSVFDSTTASASELRVRQSSVP